jgi:hypothetical protein
MRYFIIFAIFYLYSFFCFSSNRIVIPKISLDEDIYSSSFNDSLSELLIKFEKNLSSRDLEEIQQKIASHWLQQLPIPCIPWHETLQNFNALYEKRIHKEGFKKSHEIERLIFKRLLESKPLCSQLNEAKNWMRFNLLNFSLIEDVFPKDIISYLDDSEIFSISNRSDTRGMFRAGLLKSQILRRTARYGQAADYLHLFDAKRLTADEQCLLDLEKVEIAFESGRLNDAATLAKNATSKHSNLISESHCLYWLEFTTDSIAIAKSDVKDILKKKRYRSPKPNYISVDRFAISKARAYRLMKNYKSAMRELEGLSDRTQKSVWSMSRIWLCTEILITAIFNRDKETFLKCKKELELILSERVDVGINHDQIIRAWLIAGDIILFDRTDGKKSFLEILEQYKSVFGPKHPSLYEIANLF